MGRVIELRIDYPEDLNCPPFKFWYRNDKLHREDGPAADYGDGFVDYYLYGEVESHIRYIEE